MAQNSIKINFIFNILLTLSTYVAQLIVYPYVSRVLGVDNMGVVGFVNKTIDVFLIFSTLGINTIGIRAIAESKNNNKLMNEVFSSLVSFIAVSTFIVFILYLIVINSVPKFSINKELFLLGISKFIFSNFLIEWFYQGMENFRFITIRGILIKILYIILVFVFVRKETDYDNYFILTVLVVVVNSLINWYTSKRYVRFKFSIDSLKNYAKPIFSYGLYQMLNSTFSTCNYLFLGIICTPKEVGYYYTAENFYFVLLACISAFTRVMMPRMVSLLNENKRLEFDRLVSKSFDSILLICIPITIFGILFASKIINLFAGPGYEGSIIPMQIMMLLVIINAVNQIFINQIAIPFKLDKPVLIGTLVASVIALGVNYMMINRFGAIGSSVVLVVSVIVANIYPIYILFRHQYVSIRGVIFVKHFLLAIPYIVVPLFLFSLLGKDSLNAITLSLIFYFTFFYFVGGKQYVNELLIYLKLRKKRNH